MKKVITAFFSNKIGVQLPEGTPTPKVNDDINIPQMERSFPVVTVSSHTDLKGRELIDIQLLGDYKQPNITVPRFMMQKEQLALAPSAADVAMA
jgi:hypothetical protein